MHGKPDISEASDASIKIAMDFLATMFATSETGRFFIGSRPNDDSEKIDSPYEKSFIKTSSARNTEKLPKFLKQWDAPGRAMLFCTGILQDKATKRQKIFIKESCFLHTDIDLKNVELEKTVDDLIGKLKTLRCPPSVIVASGHGVHACWLFKEPISSAEMKRIENALKLLADVVGGDHEPTHIAAFLRLQGSHNSKRGEWNEVRIIEQNALRYELDELEEWLTETSPKILRKERERRGTVGQIGNQWEAYAKTCKAPTNIKERLAQMMYMGGGDSSVHKTQLDVSSSMISQEHPVDKVVEIIMAATRIAAGSYGANWDWEEEEHRVHKMCTDWVAKLEQKAEKPDRVKPSISHQDDDDNGDDDVQNIKDDYGAPTLSEESIALTFAKDHAQRLRHVVKLGGWLQWDSTRWIMDETVFAFDLARRICREAAAQCNQLKAAKIIASAKTVAAVERLAKADRRLAATTEQFDSKPFLFNETSETIELATGTVRPPRQEDYLTQKAGCRLAPAGTPHPIWTNFLNRITDNSAELVSFLQRYIGYCMTGDISEQVFVFAYGSGSNGKSTFIGTIQKMLGDYAVTADMSTFLDSYHDRHPTELAKLRGARLVISTETKAGRFWDEQKIKNITGGEIISARFMRQDFFDFEPTFKLFISGNHKPRLKNVDEAIRRRLLLVPFLVEIPKAERDPKLPEKLKSEWPAILRWALDGCLEWQRIGLAPPAIVTEATEEYFEGEDAFAMWVADECSTAIGDPNRWDRAADLFESWCEYAEKNGDHPGNSKSFHEAMTNHGFESCRKGTPQVRAFSGIRLKSKPFNNQKPKD